MATLDAKQTLKNLKSKGFAVAKSKSVDHKLTRARTKISHGEKELNDYLISCMSKQTLLSKNEFIDLAKCPMSQTEYEKILRNKGFIE
jgi:predicted RNA binding protein YcfA (HicA-like mRNA interferase family)